MSEKTKPVQLEFFDSLPSLEHVVTAAGLSADFITPEMHARPFSMILVVTRRCNSRCQMCNIWQEKDSPMLSLDQYRHIFREPLPSIRALALTGGEPTLRKDLPQIWEIARAGLPRLEYGLLATSGLNVQRTLDQTEEMLQQVEKNPGKIRSFEVQVSLDGIDEMHDHVRGIEGFFQKVQRTLEGLQRLQERYPFLMPKLSSVVMPANVQQVEPIRAFARDVGMDVHFSPAVLTGTFFNNLEEAEALGFVPGSPRTAEAQEAFRKLGEEETNSLRFYYQDIVKMLDGSPRGRTCLMGFFGCLVEHTGDVYPCPIWENQSFGNLLEQSFDEVWFGEQARTARYKLRRTGCPTCSSMCYPHSVGLKEIVQERGLRLRERARRAATKVFQSGGNGNRANGESNGNGPGGASELVTESSDDVSHT